MGLFSKIVKAVPGIGDIVETAAAVKTGIDLFAGDDDVPGEVRAAGRNVAEIARALQDPDHPMFRQLAEEEEGLITRDFTRALRQVGTENLRMMARTGGMGILDPERRDEALAGAFAKSVAGRKQAARDQARAYLSSALEANKAVAGSFAPMIAGDQRERERQASGMQMLLDLFQKRESPNFNIALAPAPQSAFAGPATGLSFTGRPAVTSYTTPLVSFR